jgi:L-threonylcarbamoyladenylate synthase
MTEVLEIDPNAPDPAVLARAGDVLRAGGLVAYPTETVYGLAASAFVVDSIARVFDAKQRPFGQALPVQIAAPEEVETLARSVSPAAKRLIADFFPGPLTLVLWRLPSVSLTVTGGGNTIGLRMPNHPVALGVLRAFGAPVVCPSANLTGRRAPMSARDVLEDLDGLIDLVLDGGETADRTPSSVLDLTTQPARLLREGKISRAELEVYVEIE